MEKKRAKERKREKKKKKIPKSRHVYPLITKINQPSQQSIKQVQRTNLEWSFKHFKFQFQIKNCIQRASCKDCIEKLSDDQI